MRDIDDRGALGLQLPEDAEQAADLAILQCRGRFIKNEQAAPSAQGLGEGDDLLLGKSELAYRSIRIRREVEGRKLDQRIVPHPRAINEKWRPQHLASRRIAQRDIFGD